MIFLQQILFLNNRNNNEIESYALLIAIIKVPKFLTNKNMDTLCANVTPYLPVAIDRYDKD